MSGTKDFELVFEGPTDESPETLRKLRTSLLADLGLSIAEAQDVLSNTPKTLKTSEIEEDLKPLYAALKKAGAKVLIVRPADALNDKAYFLDLEDAKIDDDLLKSLEALPGEEETVHEIEDIAVDLTQELAALTDEEKALESEKPAAPPAPAEHSVEAAPAERPQAENAISVSETPVEPVALEVQGPIEIAAEPPTQPKLEEKLTDTGLDLALTLDNQPGVAPAVQVESPKLEIAPDTVDPENLVESAAAEPLAPAPEASTAPTGLLDKPLFEFSSASDPEPEKPVAAAAPVQDLKGSKPLFEFSEEAPVAVAAPVAPPPASTPPVSEPVKAAEQPPIVVPIQNSPAAAAPPPTAKSSMFDDLSLSLDDPEDKPHTTAKAEPPKTKAAKKDEPVFEDLSSSLTSQLASERDITPRKTPNIAAQPLDLAVEGATPTPAQSKPKAAETPPAPVQPPVQQCANPNVVVEPEGAVKAAVESLDEKAEDPPPVPFKSAAFKNQVSLDLLLPILVGAVFLGIANWLYFNPGDEEIHLPQINFGTSDEEGESITRREVIPSTEKHVHGKAQEGELSINWSVIFDKEELKSVSIEATTPPPPDLTPEQIVRNERPVPWLYKIEVSRFPFEKQLDGTWQAKGPARVFVNQGTSKRRLVAQAEITLDSFKPGESVVGRFNVGRGYPNPPADVRFHFEQLINGDIMLFAASDLK